MTMLKFMAKVAGAAVILFGMNGLINYALMKPLDTGSDAFNLFRHHLDDAVFILLFVFVAVVPGARLSLSWRHLGFDLASAVFGLG
jgi:hypothetical protein